MKKNKNQEAKPNIDEPQARTVHRCITRYLNKEPFHSDLSNYILLDGNPYMLLSHLLRSKRPLLGKEITKTWAITEQGIWHVANKLNGYLKDLSNSYELLKSKNFIIQVPVGKGGGKGGKRFGYFLAGYDTKEQKYLFDSETKLLLEQVIAQVDISLSAKEILDKLRKNLIEEATEQLEKKLRSSIKDYQPLDLEISTIETKKNQHNIITEENADIHFKKRGRVWRSYDIKELDNFKGTCILSSDVGTGKTTFLRHLQLRLLEENKSIPVYIHASKIEKWRDVDYTSLEQYLREKLCSNLSGKIPGNFWPEVIKKDFVFLIDGLDQITGTGDAYREFLDDLLELADTNQVDIIVASRPSAVISAEENATIHFLRLKPFSTTIQKAYFGTHYDRALEICKHDLKMLAIPMLAFMVSFLIENGQDKDIVNGKDLYEHFVQYIFTKYKHDKSAISKHKRLEIREALQNISYQALADDDIKPQIVPLEFCRKQMSKLGLRIEVDDLSKHGITNFIVDEAKNSEEILFFTHQSFQEYLAAEYISQTDKHEEYQKVLSEKWNPKWKEVIKFLAGFKGQTIIEQILSEQDNPIHSKLFLSAELVPEVPSISSELRNKIFQKIESLLEDSVFVEDARKFLLYVDLSKALERLASELESKDEGVVRAAIIAATKLKDHVNKVIIEKIVSKLESKEGWVVEAAIDALMILKDHKDMNKDIVEKIAGTLESKDGGVVEAAIDALMILKDHKDMNKDIVEKIAGTLESKDGGVVEAAIDALVELKDHEDVIAKIAGKLESKDGWIVRAAINGLVKLKNHKNMNKNIIEKIAGKLDDEEKSVVEAAIDALVKLKDHKDMNKDIVEKIAGTLESKDGGVVESAIYALVELKDHEDVIAKIAGKLESKDGWIVRAAINGLVKLKNHKNMNKNIIEKIAGKLESKEGWVVQAAISALMELKDYKNMDEKIIEKIFDMLEDENKPVVQVVIKTLVRLKDYKGVSEYIIEKLVGKLDDKDERVVRAAIDSLVELKDYKDMNKDIVEKIAGTLESKNVEVVEATIKALVELKDHWDVNKDIIKKILGKLDDKDERVVEAAIDGLVELKDHRDVNENIIEKISENLESQKGLLVQITINALVKFKDHKDMNEGIVEKIAGTFESRNGWVLETALNAYAVLKFKITNDVVKKLLPNSNSYIYDKLKEAYHEGNLIS